MKFLSFRNYIFLLIIPSVVLIISFLFRWAAGPFWQFADPCYEYLFNALHMLKGIAPTLVAHPGTPLQVLILFIIFLCNIGYSAEGAISRALINPEFYLYVTYIVLTLGSFLTSVLLALYVYHKTQDKIAALLSQLPSLAILTLLAGESNYPFIPAIINVSPDAMLMWVVNLFNLCFLKLYFSKTQKDDLRAVLLLGIVCGLGVAVKLTFFPLVLAALIIISWRLKFIFSVIFAAFFVLFTLPIISRYPELFQWANGLLTHTGHYGLGSTGIVNWGSYVTAFKEITRQWPFFVISTLGLLVWASIRIVSNGQGKSIRFLWAAALGALLQYVITAKQFSMHYLLAGFGLFGCIFVLFYLDQISRKAILRKMLIVFILIFGFYYSYQAIVYCKKMSNFTQDLSNLRKTLFEKYPNCSVIPAATTATNIYLTPSHGLFLGNYGSLHKEDAEIFALYPHTFYFDTENVEPRDYEDGYGIRNFRGERVFADDLLAAGSCSIFLKLNSDFSQYPYYVRTLERSKYASAYLLEGSTEKQADELFRASMAYLQQGDLQKAFVLALKSKQLHFQPQDKVDYFINLIYQQLRNK